MVFWIISALALAGAVGAVLLPNIVHAALALAFSFFALAGLFVLLKAGFLAGIQLIVSAGAIPIVTIFVVMMTHSRLSRLDSPGRAAAAVLAVLLLGGGFLLPVFLATGGGTQVVAAQNEDLGFHLVNTYLLPFEVAAVILLVAFVGAIVLARTAPPGEEGR